MLRNHLGLFLAASMALSGAGLAQDRSEVAMVKSVLNQLQGLSFKNNREYCGYIGFDSSGKLRAGKARRGRINDCEANWPDNLEVVASYHTHGAFDEDVPAEFPSVSDIEADESEGIDGYVATPGGRLWYVDTTDMVVSQICGIGCLSTDPNFQAGLDGKIRRSYTYRQLIQLEAGN